MIDKCPMQSNTSHPERIDCQFLSYLVAQLASLLQDLVVCFFIHNIICISSSFLLQHSVLLHIEYIYIQQSNQEFRVYIIKYYSISVTSSIGFCHLPSVTISQFLASIGQLLMSASVVRQCRQFVSLTPSGSVNKLEMCKGLKFCTSQVPKLQTVTKSI